MSRELFSAVDSDVVVDIIVVSTVTLEVKMVNHFSPLRLRPTLVREQMLLVKVKVLQCWETEQLLMFSTYLKIAVN